MKRLIILLLIPVISFIVSCDLLDDDDSVTGPQLGDKLVDTTLNASYSDVAVSIEEGVTVTIPKGITTDDFNLIIREIDNLPESPETIQILTAYDIELSFDDEFDDFITIRYDIQPDVFADKSESDFAVGFYNEAEKKWQMFSDYEINFQNGYVECKTKHLTPVGFIEFITTGGYAHKFISNNITVYYSLKSGAPMGYTEYQPEDKPWHIPTGDENWAPTYIQDVAHYINEAREAFADDPYNLEITDGNIKVYVTDLKGNDGEYGSVSGAVYLNNTMKLPNDVSGISYQDVLRATCAHELLHLVQDNYYVMNKGNIGLWWLEATATQADRMVWGNELLYSESEMFSIESKATLLETLSKSWDDCNNDPNWYLAGCFLQYMSNYREGDKLNIANSIKRGGDNTNPSLMRVILNEQIKDELNSNIMDEYRDYVIYLFTGGNEKLSAIPANNDFSIIESATSLTKSIKMSKKENTQSATVSIPYLATQIISVSNIENSKMQINYECSKIDGSLEGYIVETDNTTGSIKVAEHIYKGMSGSIELDARSGGDIDNFFIVLINTGFTEGKDEASFTFTTNTDFSQFSFLSFKLEGDSDDIKYSNGKEDNALGIGFSPYKGYDTERYKVLSKSFTGSKFNLQISEKKDYDYIWVDYESVATIKGEYSTSEFTYIEITEEIVKYEEVWSDDKDDWVKNKIMEVKQIEYENIPFFKADNEYDFVYTYAENDKSNMKNKLKKLSHTIKVEDDDGKLIEEYYLLPVDFNDVASYFMVSMTTTK